MKRILLVDDHADTLECLAELLSASYEVVCATGGADAVFAASAQPLDAIILDLMMPIVDGASVIEELRARSIRVPVVVASGSLDVARTARRLGAADFVVKPYEYAVLEEKLARITSGPETSRVNPVVVPVGREIRRGS